MVVAPEFAFFFEKCPGFLFGFWSFDPKSILYSAQYRVFNSDFGWTLTEVDLVGVHPKIIYLPLKIPSRRSWNPGLFQAT
jgi:hypothetical protein